MNDIQSEFLSTISHELRTPLTSIRGFADTLLNSGDMLSDEQKKKFLIIIKEQSSRLIKMTENILTVSKTQTEAENLVLKSFNPKPKLEILINMVKNQYTNNNFEFTCVKNNSDIYADEDKFQQIMLNLIENGAKYSKTGTTVKVELKENENEVIIKVKDIGAVIEDKDKEIIFDKFTRLQNPLTQTIEGSGLGLYIVKTYIDKMNGKITVNSDVNETVFEVRFPISTLNDTRIKTK